MSPITSTVLFVTGHVALVLGVYLFWQTMKLRNYAIQSLKQASLLHQAAQVRELNAVEMHETTQHMVETGKLPVKKFHINFTKYNQFNTKEKRKALAMFLSRVLHADSPVSHFEPYQKVETDDLEWVLDSANNWWLHFDRNQSEVVRIVHRYNLVPLERAVALLLCHHYAIGSVIVEE